MPVSGIYEAEMAGRRQQQIETQMEITDGVTTENVADMVTAAQQWYYGSTVINGSGDSQSGQANYTEDNLAGIAQNIQELDGHSHQQSEWQTLYSQVSTTATTVIDQDNANVNKQEARTKQDAQNLQTNMSCLQTLLSVSQTLVGLSSSGW